MISPEPQYDREYRSVEIPESYYELIQKLAFKFNTSTRVIGTVLMNRGLQSTKSINDLDNACYWYDWYQENRAMGATGLSDKDKETLKLLIKKYEI